MALRKLISRALRPEIGLALLLAACAAPRKETHRWYQSEPVIAEDTSPLKGKVIAIDPGHGGKFTGAKGKGGLEEKEVNLKVALALKAMLVRAGAVVRLTREDDRDFLKNPSEHVREDLKRRIAFLDTLSPDLFLSVHHNSNTRDQAENRTMTFYKMEDPGASLDAAASIHRSFIRSLRISPQELDAGNYFVLWNSKTPAVLGEPSYLTHPEIESILNNDKAIRIEAAAYFNGILEWFAGGIPKVADISYDSATCILRAEINSDRPLDTLTTGITLDGRPMPVYFRGNTVFSSTNGPLPNGWHTVHVTAANISGNSAFTRDRNIIINRDPAMMNAFCPRLKCFPGERVPVKIFLNDDLGFPASNGLLISTNTGLTTVTREGEALLYPAAGGSQREIVITCKNMECRVPLSAEKSAPKYFQGFVKSAPKAVKAVVTASGMDFSTDYNGFFEYPEAYGPWAIIRCEGYVDTVCSLSVSTALSINLFKSYEGLFFDRKIVIDPEFGGAEFGGSSPGGLRASDINRKIAGLLAGRFRKAGATVILTREQDNTIHVTERIKIAGRAQADLYFLVKSDSGGSAVPTVSYYPTSRLGGVAASLIKARADTLIKNVLAAEESGYVLQQTPCTAVAASLAPLKDTDRLSYSDLDRISLAIFNGTLDFLKYLKKSNQELD